MTQTTTSRQECPHVRHMFDPEGRCLQCVEVAEIVGQRYDDHVRNCYRCRDAYECSKGRRLYDEVSRLNRVAGL